MFVLAAACVGLPKPPDEHPELNELWQQYDAPTAVLDANDAMALSTASGWLAQARLIGGFSFVQERLTESVERASESGDIRELVRAQGSITIHEPCPGFDEAAPPNSEENGYFEVTLGVRSSAIQRTFDGFARDCRFLSNDPDGDEVEVTLTADFTADLGDKVELGAQLPSELLISVSDLTLDVVGGSLDVQAEHEAVDFRLKQDAIETLVELPAAGVDGTGTAVVVFYMGGAIGVRVSDGEWQCGMSGAGCLQ